MITKPAKSFEELGLFKKARELTNNIYEITRNNIFCKDFALRDQIRRASISIMSNIAEGFERGSNTEFIQYLFIAKGSCGEVRSQLTIASDQRYIDIKNYEILSLDCRNLGGMLSNLIKYLQGSEFKGAKRR